MAGVFKRRYSLEFDHPAVLPELGPKSASDFSTSSEVAGVDWQAVTVALQTQRIGTQQSEWAPCRHLFLWLGADAATWLLIMGSSGYWPLSKRLGPSQAISPRAGEDGYATWTFDTSGLLYSLGYPALGSPVADRVTATVEVLSPGNAMGCYFPKAGQYTILDLPSNLTKSPWGWAEDGVIDTATVTTANLVAWQTLPTWWMRKYMNEEAT